MNFVKRAGLSLWARKGRTLITLCTFLVISVMVLAGVLINDATAQARREATRSVGAEVSLGMDPGDLSGSGGGFQAPRIDASTVDELGGLPQVRKYTYSMWDRGILKGNAELVTEGAQGGMGPGGTATVGVLDSSLRADFRSGRFRLLSGRHLTAADKDDRLLLIEERLARKNGLRVGGRITLGSNDGTSSADFTVAGIYRDPRPVSEPDPEYGVNPANMLYASVGAFAGLNSGGDGAAKDSGGGSLQVAEATFLLRDADDLNGFKKEAETVAGPALDGFALDANDKALRQMTGPLKSIGSTATLAMWLIGVAGAAVLALLVNLAVKQRRREYGVLLAMGEKKGGLIAQQALEMVVVAALAVGLSSLFTGALTQYAGQSLLGREAAAAQRKIDSWEAPPPGSTGLDRGLDPDDKPVENADPVDRITVRLDRADLATVGGVGLGIALLATALPAGAVLRLSPRAILTKGK
ncbi:ABC transporter permease [Streptomyces sp. NBC_01723]|uniref:ABC transporter permease n=1 Tax=unclassified Streptomyces TaxID=2593676 RepID=UPI0027808512|nr:MULTISPECIES: ABC transporter permease [unclassified Streptomyces]MDQ0401705.1 putative ABC transport system permease protein [Streptomyces sp. DSM 40167]